jgi:hypothetical protein
VVIDIAGEAGRNRFNLVEVTSAVWNDATLTEGITDLADALSLVDVFAHALMVRR